MKIGEMLLQIQQQKLYNKIYRSYLLEYLMLTLFTYLHNKYGPRNFELCFKT